MTEGIDETAAAKWERFRRALGAEPFPAAVVDLDAFYRNVDWMRERAKAATPRLRIATKSIRCPALVERALARLGERGAGLMTYTAAETAFWAERGQKDLVLAYPTVRPAELASLVAAARAGATPAMVVDDEAQLADLEKAAADGGVQLPFVIELDVSLRASGGVHLGVRRSPLHEPAEVVALAEQARRFTHLTFHGLMAYEAQIAGLTDSSPFSRWTNPAKRLIKLASRRRVADARRETVEALVARGFQPRVVNGGGSGSLAWARSEQVLTDVTIGSGLIGSHLFDYYRDLLIEPAAYFALQVTRRPAPGVVTCHGGGWVASGPAGEDRLPLPELPPGLSLLSREGAGEVQTPLRVAPDTRLELGDPVFFRHAKAGELAEHFNEYLLIQGERVVERAPTYRGLGRQFLG